MLQNTKQLHATCISGAMHATMVDGIEWNRIERGMVLRAWNNLMIVMCGLDSR
jgi:hypothetical protein